MVQQLDPVFEIARSRLEPMGIVVVSDPQSRVGPESHSLSYTYTRNLTLSFANVQISARIWWRPSPGDCDVDEVSATWRSEAWHGVGANFHSLQGTLPAPFADLSEGALERLVLALLQEANEAFPAEITRIQCPVFSNLSADR